MDNSNLLDPAEIDAALAGTAFHSRLHHFATIESTNTHALEQAKAGAPHGSYYIADEQTAGRGRSDHQWISKSGEGLYLSVLLRPNLPTADLVWLPLLAGLVDGQLAGVAAWHVAGLLRIELAIGANGKFHNCIVIMIDDVEILTVG